MLSSAQIVTPILGLQSEHSDVFLTSEIRGETAVGPDWL